MKSENVVNVDDTKWSVEILRREVSTAIYQLLSRDSEGEIPVIVKKENTVNIQIRQSQVRKQCRGPPVRSHRPDRTNDHPIEL